MYLGATNPEAMLPENYAEYYWREVLFMVSEYTIFGTGAVATGIPRVRRVPALLAK